MIRPVSTIIHEKQKLADIAGEVERRWKRIETSVRVAQTAGKAAVEDAIAIGHKLNEAKKALGHGRWLKWFHASFRLRSIETAQRWMRLTNASLVTDLKDCSNLKEAYYAVGILTRPDVVVDEEAGTITFTIDVALRIVAPLKRLKPADVQTLPAAQQFQLRKHLEPFHELYLSLPDSQCGGG